MFEWCVCEVLDDVSLDDVIYDVLRPFMFPLRLLMGSLEGAMFGVGLSFHAPAMHCDPECITRQKTLAQATLTLAQYSFGLFTTPRTSRGPVAGMNTFCQKESNLKMRKK